MLMSSVVESPAAAYAVLHRVHAVDGSGMKRKNLVVALLWFVASFLALVIFWKLRIRHLYVEEQFSEISSSAWMFHPHVADWFIKPFSRYRMNYPEWNPLYRCFIRPTECLHYYVCSLIFGSNFAAYLVANYFYMAATCGLTFYIASQLLKLRSSLAHLLTFLVFVSPAYGQQQSFLLTFAADPMAGFWIIAAITLFLARRYVLAWILIVLAVGAKETAWPIPLAMAVIVLVAFRKPLRQRIAIAAAYCLPLLGIIALRGYAFGMAGAWNSDEGPASLEGSGGGAVMSAGRSAVEKLLQGLARWPFGVLAHSQQYDPRMLMTFRVWGYAVDALVWATLTFFVGRAALRAFSASESVQGFLRRIERFASGYSFATWATAIFVFASLAFPIRFIGGPRYGAPAYPLILLSLGILLSLRNLPRFPRLVALGLLVSIGVYGVTFRISDATRGVRIFGAEWQLVAGYRQAIEMAGNHPLFVVDDATGGEINSEAIQRFYGPEVKVVRVNDLFKTSDCRILPDSGDLPLQLSVDAQQLSGSRIFIRSVITGCGGHNFLGAPKLPKGLLSRSAFGYRMTYDIDPRTSPQMALGKPRLMEVMLENVPSDTIIVAPDLAHRTYRVVPIAPEGSSAEADRHQGMATETATAAIH